MIKMNFYGLTFNIMVDRITINLLLVLFLFLLPLVSVKASWGWILCYNNLIFIIIVMLFPFEASAIEKFII